MTQSLDVYLDGLLTGRLTRGRDDRVGFQYLDGSSVTPLSISMPRAREHHDPDVVMPWLDNLLPDNDDVRARWAGQFGERRVTPFNLLRHVGADCAGAVQIMPAGATPVSFGTLTPISEAEIAGHIRTLRGDAAAWDFAEKGGRWSLGGQQGKFALAQASDGSWLLPGGRAPSTHIVKVGIAGIPNSDVAEFVTMRAAALLGLPVPPVDYVGFEDEYVLMATRFDRLAEGDEVRRLHQEDLCQALGIWRTMKYQSDGGPSVRTVVELLRAVLDVRDRARGVNDFARMQIFNWLVAGTDAHAKNYALLHLGTRVALAPFYDLVSAAFFLPARDLHFEGRLAMKFGGEYRLRKVDLGRFSQFADDVGVDEDFLIATARSYRQELPDAVASALNDLPPSLNSGIQARMIDAIIERLAFVKVP